MSADLSKSTEELWNLCLARNINLRAEHIPGIQNVEGCSIYMNSSYTKKEPCNIYPVYTRDSSTLWICYFVFQLLDVWAFAFNLVQFCSFFFVVGSSGRAGFRNSIAFPGGRSDKFRFHFGFLASFPSDFIKWTDFLRTSIGWADNFKIIWMSNGWMVDDGW
ncbi:hypothetical protein RhiirA5_507216 [Rhizophagus irregularis]|uniref:Uncharacterized protein n=1 Tax=Rhizophagus irregularis TaxID=588596 RepID=A0A2N0NM60_9GLOM|nr:hypothetical protein RhiirA5_507216 [Rhizophagus irregularis]PKC54148.1 hypothetical protein RhiirA1_477884 [Rhizophagus irregularis]